MDWQMVKLGGRPRGRTLAVIVCALVIASGCGSPQASLAPSGLGSPGQPNSTGRPTSTGQPSTTGRPTAGELPSSTEPAASIPSGGASAEPTPTNVPPTDAPPTPASPLPDPELESASEIAEALFERSQAEQAVVSMLKVLGIGIYSADGSPIRPGAEASDSDLYMFEPEVRGLAEMTRTNESDPDEGWIAFSDFHAALADLGFAGSAEDLAQAYNSAYEQDYEAPVPYLVTAMASIDPSAPLPPLAAWLMFVDGFVPPAGGSATIASLGAGLPLVAADTPRWGVARDEVQQFVPLPLEADPLLVAHLMPVVHGASLTVTSSPGEVHEGHGSNGEPSTLTATVFAVASTFISPLSRRPLFPLNPVGGAGLPVTWHIDPQLSEHGSADMSRGNATDVLHRATVMYTPRQEAANGEGYLTRTFGFVQASVPANLLITQLYGMPSLGALVGGDVRGFARLEVEWHEPQAMRINLVDTYDVTIDLILGKAHATGTDTFAGILALQEDGSWRGVVDGTTTASYSGSVLDQPCSTSWSATQLMEITGKAAPTALDGDFVFQFKPVSQPSGSLGSGDCKPSLTVYDGFEYAPFNDYRITAPPELGQGLVVYLPDRPGGSRDYPSRLEGVVTANWHVEIEFLEPTT
jgi:hypothetical protein